MHVPGNCFCHLTLWSFVANQTFLSINRSDTSYQLLNRPGIISNRFKKYTVHRIHTDSLLFTVRVQEDMIGTVIYEYIRRHASCKCIEKRYTVFSTKLINLDQIA